MRVRLLTLCAFLCSIALTSYGQDSLSAIDKILNFPQKFIEKITKKANRLEDKLFSYSEKALRKLEKQEQKLKKKLAKKDSLAALQVFGDVEGKYTQLRQQLTTSENKLNRFKEYIPGLDTLKTSLNFLSKNAGSFLTSNKQAGQLKDALKSINGVQEKLQGTEAVRNYLKQRRQQLKEQLGKFGLAKQFQKYNKQAFYYSQQIREYQSILQDPQKRERKALELITKLPLFQKFFSEHSELAQLFPAPANYGTIEGLQGLQTRTEVQELLQRQMSAGGPNAGQMVQQNIQQAQTQLHRLKEKIAKAGGDNSDFDVPDFKANTQKVKSFWKRITVGTDLQNTRSTNFVPTSTDLGVSVGYRINDKSIVGVGGAYKMAWKGKLNNLTLTHEGISIRSYIDWKLPKGKLYLSGGYEQVYRKQFTNIGQLKQADYWQSSGLLGLSKIISLKKSKLFRQTKMQLLWDFLYNTHTPVTQPVLFRFGYSL